MSVLMANLIIHLKEGHFLVVQLLYVNLKPWDAKVHRFRKARPNSSSRSTVTQMRAQFFTPLWIRQYGFSCLMFPEGDNRESSLTCFKAICCFYAVQKIKRKFVKRSQARAEQGLFLYYREFWSFCVRKELRACLFYLFALRYWTYRAF